jgi:hypothetical protein
MVTAGEKIRLSGAVSDPDGNTVTVRWWQMKVGSYPGEITISNPGTLQTQVLVPKEAVPGQTIHVILEATDNGSPALARYQRVIITVRGQ